MTPKKSRRKRYSNPGSSTFEADAITTRPTRRSYVDDDDYDDDDNDNRNSNNNKKKKKKKKNNNNNNNNNKNNIIIIMMMMIIIIIIIIIISMMMIILMVIIIVFLERLSVSNMFNWAEQVQVRKIKHMHVKHPKQLMSKQLCSNIQLSSKDG